MSEKCSNLQIYNPATNRCVLLSGKIGMKLVLQHVNGQIVLSASDIDKAMKYPPTSKLFQHLKKVPAEIKSHGKAVVPVPLIGSKIKKQLIKIAQKAKNVTSNRYHDDAHKNYCDTPISKRPVVLRTPFVVKDYTTIFPTYILRRDRIMQHFKNSKLISTESLFQIDHNQFKLKTKVDNQNERWVLNENLCGSTSKSINDMLESTIDYDWIRKQNEYILNLSLKELCTILGYTFHGDVIVNNYHRGKLSETAFIQGFGDYYGEEKPHPVFFQFLDEIANTKNITDIIKPGMESATVVVMGLQKDRTGIVKDFVQSVHSGKHKGQTMTNFDKHAIMVDIARHLKFEFWNLVIKRFSDDLQSILKNAPRISKTMNVYRGVKNDFYLDGNKRVGTKKKWMTEANTPYYANDGFVSTSVSRLKAYSFINQSSLCCFKKITLLPGTTALLLFGVSYFPDEMEILLGIETIYLIRKKKQKCNFYLDPAVSSFCHQNERKVVVQTSDIVVVS